MIELFGHPFSSFTWKALIALYERDLPFRLRIVDPDHPDNVARIAELSPTGQFPAIVDGAHATTGSNAVIAYLDLVGDAPPMVPGERRAEAEARQMADLFDDYVSAAQQRFVADALRPEGERDAYGLAEARRTLDRTYAWLDRWMERREWAANARFGIADCAAAPALFYADWSYPIPPSAPALRAYRARLLRRPSVARAVDEARPYRSLFPLGAPDRD